MSEHSKQKLLDLKPEVSFSQKLFWSIFAMFSGFMVCFLIFQYQREHDFAQEKLRTVLSNYNHQLSERIRKDSDITKNIHSFIEEIHQKDIRITIISPNGTVLFDNSEAASFNNHNDRNEVKAARLHGEGFSIRSSISTNERYFYTASNIDDYIYRTALPWEKQAKQALMINKDFIYFLLLMAFIFFLILSRFTFSIGQTIAKLRNFALKEKKGVSNIRTYVFPNDELGDIAKYITILYQKQNKAKEALKMEREKLIKHFQYSSEGFAMFASDGSEILSNRLFIQFANLISDIQIQASEKVIQIPELKELNDFIEEQQSIDHKVVRKSIIIDKNGKTFLFESILFIDNSYEISINDITRQEEESRMKRQLTQNIAHELKTPVSSIQGYLETIIHNPDLDREKQQYFLDRCFSQSTRLAGLLRDISVLNRIDEASSLFELTTVNIAQLIEKTEMEIANEIEAKHFTTHVAIPEDTIISGNQSLLYSIFRNLYDNALAYAGNGSEITVSCYKEDEKFYYFSFSDNGIGIAEEHINRIFERFYRIDKGRSRKMGGTGLGLSIVKNGVLFHKGQISAKSSPGNGVTFLFTLKKKI